MEKLDFTLDYFGKKVAGTREGNNYLLQISYVPLNLEKTVADSGSILWLDKGQKRETQLAREVGSLLEKQGFAA
ncbi:hypothetical protein [Flavisolibacter nicotianae]|uniref:hypothetical protein n=1 Tax=Flavisolibacter nicotianae TaxID=2364882 RepID=UPI000EAED614|nr:hypothetical protein [Flavisolibacter nicotianae]